MPIGKTPVKERFEEYIQHWIGKVKIGKTKTAGQIKGSLFFFTEKGNSDMAFDHWYPANHNLEKDGAYVMSHPADFLRAMLEIQEMEIEKKPTTIIFDTIEGLVQVIVNSLLNEYGEQTINDGKMAYGKGWKMVQKQLWDIIANLQKLNVGIIFTSHLEEKTITRLNKEPETVWRSTLPDQAKTIIQGLVDFIWFFTQEGKERWIYTQGDTSIEAGSRITLPNRIPMGKSPQQCYQNILTAFYGKGNNKDRAKEQIITRILKGEAYLCDKKIDKFDTEKRVTNSRKKHLGFEDPELAGLPELQEYLQHLITKAKNGGDNGNA